MFMCYACANADYLGFVSRAMNAFVIAIGGSKRAVANIQKVPTNKTLTLMSMNLFKKKKKKMKDKIFKKNKKLKKFIVMAINLFYKGEKKVINFIDHFIAVSIK